jgi:(heptosyl)LPS beta-1,4-glucosyltransferase
MSAVAFSGVVIARNEADRIGRCVRSLREVCGEVLVLDAESTDATVQVALDAGARVLTQPWLGFAAQKNHAIAAAREDWVLLLDADEWLSPEAVAGLRALGADRRRLERRDAYALARRTRFLGRWLKYGGWGREWLPRLFRRELRYRPVRVHEALDLAGRRLGRLPGALLHDPVRSLDEHYAKLERYARLWAEDRQASGRSVGFARVWAAPAFYWVKNYWLRGGFLDGPEGYLYHRAWAHYVHGKYARWYAATRVRGA